MDTGRGGKEDEPRSATSQFQRPVGRGSTEANGRGARENEDRPQNQEIGGSVAIRPARFAGWVFKLRNPRDSGLSTGGMGSRGV